MRLKRDKITHYFSSIFFRFMSIDVPRASILSWFSFLISAMLYKRLYSYANILLITFPLCDAGGFRRFLLPLFLARLFLDTNLSDSSNLDSNVQSLWILKMHSLLRTFNVSPGESLNTRQKDLSLSVIERRVIFGPRENRDRAIYRSRNNTRNLTSRFRFLATIIFWLEFQNVTSTRMHNKHTLRKNVVRSTKRCSDKRNLFK